MKTSYILAFIGGGALGLLASGLFASVLLLLSVLGNQ